MTWMCQCPRELDDAVPVCGSCAQERPNTPLQLSTHRCASCDLQARPVELTDGEDGLARGGSCHVLYLRQRMERDPR